MENTSTNISISTKISQLLGIGGGLCFALVYLCPIASLTVGIMLLISVAVLYFTRAKFVLPLLSCMKVDTSAMSLDFPKSKSQLCKSIIAVCSLALVTLVSLGLVCRGAYTFEYLHSFSDSLVKDGEHSKIVLTTLQKFDLTLYFLPLLSLIGFYFFLSPNFISSQSNSTSTSSVDDKI